MEEAPVAAEASAANAAVELLRSLHKPGSFDPGFSFTVRKWEMIRRSVVKKERRVAPPLLCKLDRDRLLEIDLGARFFELLLGRFRVGLGSAFEDGLRSAFDKRLGVGEAETGLHFAHSLDDGDLLVRWSRHEDKGQDVRCRRARVGTAFGAESNSRSS